MIVLCTREAVMGDKRSGEIGKSEGLGDKLNMVSGGRYLVLRIIPMSLSSHKWIMMVSINHRDR